MLFSNQRSDRARLRRPLLGPGFFLAILGACLAATAQLVPDAPVVNFRLPMFGDDGFLDWELWGKEGRYLSDDQVDLAGMRLLIYAKDQRDRVETEIISPQAALLIEKNQIVGDETITVVGDHFVVRGDHWTWDGNRETVVIDENVKVTFFEELTGILK